MSYWINPDLYCSEWRCRRPKAAGREYCTPCIRLARAVGRRLDDEPIELTVDLDIVHGRVRSHLAACVPDPRSRAYASWTPPPEEDPEAAEEDPEAAEEDPEAADEF